MRLVALTTCLRLHDNPALAAANGGSALVVLDPAPPLPERAASWRACGLHLFLAELERQGVPVLDATRLDERAWRVLRGLAPELQLDVGDPATSLPVAHAARAVGLGVVGHQADLVPAPELVLNPAGRLPRSFSAFHRLFQARVAVADPRPVPQVEPWQPPMPPELEACRLRVETLPAPGPLPEGDWRPGEGAALARLEALLETDWPVDPAHWDRADGGGSTFLSPWLARGELGPRTVWAALEVAAQEPRRTERARGWQRQLVWREYAKAFLRERPDLPWAPVAEAWADFPRRPDPSRLAAWREGRCGIPIVDAALRQLSEEGWIHNRLRMMAGTWLVKQMGQPWQDGLKIFEEWLVDWDPALNAMNWQWCAGCGVDAQPWFRLFSPEKQAERADPEGRLLRRWLPELAGLTLPVARRAWALTPLERAGTGYPTANPDPVQGRAEALAAWTSFRGEP